jgi:hypothetical protein
VGAGCPDQRASTACVSNDVAAQVRAVIDEVGDLSRLAPLKERLPDEISYDELRCVVEAVKRRHDEAGR